MVIILTDHTRLRMRGRGISEAEVHTVISEGRWREARDGRVKADHAFLRPTRWSGRDYSGKRVEVIFEEHGDTIVVVTVKAFYFTNAGD